MTYLLQPMPMLDVDEFAEVSCTCESCLKARYRHFWVYTLCCSSLILHTNRQGFTPCRLTWPLGPHLGLQPWFRICKILWIWILDLRVRSLDMTAAAGQASLLLAELPTASACCCAAKFCQKNEIFWNGRSLSNIWPSACPDQIRHGSACRILQMHVMPFQSYWHW